MWRRRGGVDVVGTGVGAGGVVGAGVVDIGCVGG